MTKKARRGRVPAGCGGHGRGAHGHGAGGMGGTAAAMVAPRLARIGGAAWPCGGFFGVLRCAVRCVRGTGGVWAVAGAAGGYDGWK